jgi:hypothetical protein
VRILANANEIVSQPRLRPEAKSDAASGNKKLDDDEKEQVRKLKARDAEVRAHEAAHSAAAGGQGGGASFSFQQGPDGNRYAVGGEVPVQIQAGSTPEETIRNAQTVRSAALAPADPSGQDRAVAAQAAVMESKAREELSAKTSGTDDSGDEKPVSKSRTDPSMLVSSLETEQRQAYGGRGHEHSDSGCGICARAASRYAS